MNKKVLIGIVIVVLIAGMVAANFLMNRDGSAPAFGGGSSFPVKVAAIQKGDISSYITANGVIEEVEKAEVFFDTPLKVEKVFVKKGQKVAKGQEILKLDTSSMVSELEKLKVNKNIQELSLNSKTADSEAERALSALKTAERNYTDSQKTYSSNKELYAANAISRNELDLSENAMVQAENALSDARSAYSIAVENKNVNRSTAEENLKITNLSIADLESRLAKINASVISPMDGVVAAISLEEGAYTNSVESAYKIINPDKLQIKANIKEFDTKNVAVGQLVRITGDAIDKEKKVEGKVFSISPVAIINRTSSGDETVVEVAITLDNPDGILKPGLNVACDIYTVDKKGVIVAPMEMITEDKDGNKLVYVVNNGVMKETRVKLGINSDMTVEVMEGLKEGDQVVLEPQPTYKDGAKARILEDGKK